MRATSAPRRRGFDWGNWGRASGAKLGVEAAGPAPEAAGFDPRSRGLGYLPDVPDIRDFTVQAPAVREVLEHLLQENLRMTQGGDVGVAGTPASHLLDPGAGPLPGRHDLRETGFFTRVEDQGAIGSCTAQAVVGLVEYLMRAGGAGYQDMSRLFLYKSARRLLRWTGDTGAFLRTTIKAMALFGVPPEDEWPYDGARLDSEPEAYHYAYASNFRALRYARLDEYNSSGSETLDRVRRALFDGFPVAFGFPVHASIARVSWDSPWIPLPGQNDPQRGGHAVLAVGYDDGFAIDGDQPGALIVRNSWGPGWARQGYGYLPYRYVREELAVDFWTIFNREWIDLSAFA